MPAQIVPFETLGDGGIAPVATLTRPDLNPIRTALAEARQVVPEADAPGMASLVRKRNRNRQVSMIRKASAAEAIAGLELGGVDVYGLTSGQFSLLELIEAVLDVTGPAELVLSTWTAAPSDGLKIKELLDAGKLTAVRFVLDISFHTRRQGVALNMAGTFGEDCFRYCKTHSKFFLVTNERWRLVCKTSMNLNMNRRNEDFDLTQDAALYEFLRSYVDQLFKAGRRR